MVILQIVPQLPPSIDGVGDHGLNLARQMRADFGVQTQFVVGNPKWNGEPLIDGFPIHCLKQRSADELHRVISQLGAPPASVLLHYVGYGYQVRGCPTWLINGLQHWRGQHRPNQLVTMFHEISASGPPWTSAFWLAAWQRHLAGRLTRLSDSSLTSKQYYAQILDQLRHPDQPAITCLPVYSNVGEPTQIRPFAQRMRRLVVFGSRTNRLRVYEEDLMALKQTCQALKIIEICDVGAPTGLPFPELLEIPVMEKGVVPAVTMSDILQDAIAGFLSSPPPDYLAKSGVFAAFCAYGLTPILTTASSTPIDDLMAGTHYWTTNSNLGNLSLERAQAIATHAHKWYQSHSLPIQAQIFVEQLRSNPE